MTILLFRGHATTPEPRGLCSFIHSGSHSALLLMQFCHFGRIRLAFDVHFMLGLDVFIIFTAILCHNGLRSAPVKAKTNYVHWQKRFHVCGPLSSQSVSRAVNINKPARRHFIHAHYIYYMHILYKSCTFGDYFVNYFYIFDLDSLFLWGMNFE